METLFPEADEELAGISPRTHERTSKQEYADITEEEMAIAIKKMGTRNSAPGPDGVPKRVLSLTLGTLGHKLTGLFNNCIAAGKIPKSWKTTNLVLIPKPGKDLESPSTYRPICLLSEVGKLFERVIAIRMHKHLAQEGPNLADT